MNEQEIKDLLKNEINSAVAAWAANTTAYPPRAAAHYTSAQASVVGPIVDGIVAGIAKSIVANKLQDEDKKTLDKAMYAINYIYGNTIPPIPGTVGLVNPATITTIPKLPIPPLT